MPFNLIIILAPKVAYINDKNEVSIRKPIIKTESSGTLSSLGQRSQIQSLDNTKRNDSNEKLR
jgi:hypothetical protein